MFALSSFSFSCILHCFCEFEPAGGFYIVISTREHRWEVRIILSDASLPGSLGFWSNCWHHPCGFMWLPLAYSNFRCAVRRCDEEFHCVAPFLVAGDRSGWLREPLCFECQEVWRSQARCPRWLSRIRWWSQLNQASPACFHKGLRRAISSIPTVVANCLGPPLAWMFFVCATNVAPPVVAVQFPSGGRSFPLAPDFAATKLVHAIPFLPRNEVGESFQRIHCQRWSGCSYTVPKASAPLPLAVPLPFQKKVEKSTSVAFRTRRCPG